MTGGERLPGLGVLSTAPAVALAAWMTLASPLPELGLARPWAAILLAVPAAAAAVLVERSRSGRASDRRQPASGAVGAVLLVALAWGVLSALMHAEQVLLRRDPGSYAQIGHWLATTGRLVIPDALAVVGGPQPGISGASPGFYTDGADVIPQFLVGAHLSHAVGWWLGGWNGLFAVSAVAGAAALVAFGGLVARLVGPAWAPPAVLLLALLAPILHMGRVAGSEPLAMLLLIGGLCLLIDALEGNAPFTAVAGGALVGLGTLARADVLREVILLALALTWVHLRGNPAARWAAAGLLAGTLVGGAAAWLHSLPYLNYLRDSLLPLVAVGLLVLLAGSLLMLRARSWPPPSARVGAIIAAATGAILLLLASRPLWLVVRQDPRDPVSVNVAGMQQRSGLPVDGGRTYAENSVIWLSWWVGWVAVALAAVAAVLLVRRTLASRHPTGWDAVLPVVLGTTVLTLWRPAITPDHPWADRRLVPIVLPGLVLLVIWVLSRLAALDRLRGGRGRALVGVLGASVLLPALAASAPVVLETTERGSVAAIADACAAVGTGDVALLVTPRARLEWAPALRSQCGAEAVLVRTPTSALLTDLADRVRERGGRPVLVATDSTALLALGAVDPQRVVSLESTEDPHTLVTRPGKPGPLGFELWTAEVPGAT